MSNYYALLGIDAAAPSDEVKRAFRREVSRYHPDKVQHLGPEFLDLATSRSAVLTEAYRVLMDDELRRAYDAQLPAINTAPDLKVGPAAGVTERAPDLKVGPAAGVTERAPDLKVGPTAGVTERAPDLKVGPAAGVTERRPDLQVGRGRAVERDGGLQGPASLELVKRAVLMKIRDAAVAQGGAAMPASGFDAVYQLKGRQSLFRNVDPAVTLAVRIVPAVDAASVEAAWLLAIRSGSRGRTTCVMLVGSGVAAARDLAATISGLRQKSGGTGPLVVPVDIRDWQALLPPETPGSVRSLLNRIRNNS